MQSVTRYGSTKLHETEGRVQLVVLKKFKTAEILAEHARRMCNLHACYMKNGLVFSQSVGRKFRHVNYLKLNPPDVMK